MRERKEIERTKGDWENKRRLRERKEIERTKGKKSKMLINSSIVCSTGKMEKREKANSKMFINPVQGKYRGGGIPAQVRGRGWGRVIFKEL